LKFSVITPSLNADKHIEKAIQSVLEQDYSNWEHIVVDGGSTDGTLDILKKYPHLKWTSEKDKGIYDAMNKGIKMADGEWIYFLGSDDYLLKEKIFSKLFPFLEKNIDVIYGNIISPRFGGSYDGAFDIYKILIKNISHQAIFFNRSVFDKIDIFNLKYKSQADWDHNMRWLLNPKIISKYVPIDIAFFSDHGFSSNLNDPLFQKDKILNYINYGLIKIPLNHLKKLIRKEIKEAKKKKSYSKIIEFVFLYIKILIVKRLTIISQ